MTRLAPILLALALLVPAGCGRKVTVKSPSGWEYVHEVGPFTNFSAGVVRISFPSTSPSTQPVTVELENQIGRAHV